jgi:hypothetical protein
MREVFKDTRAVLIWLGLASLETSQALEFLSTLTGNSDQFGIEKCGLAWTRFDSPKVTSATSDTLQLLKDAISAHVHIFL